MLKEQRCGVILSQLRQNGMVTIDELTLLTRASRSTIRRDMEELELEYALKRVRGGAVCLEEKKPERELPFLMRQDCFLEEKKRIAKAARSLISPNETLLLGSGTTVFELAKTLRDLPELYVATNDLKSACILAEYDNLNLTVLGGSLRQHHYSLNGYFTEQMVEQMHADKAFIGIDAVDLHLGYMNFSTAEVQTDRFMMHAANQSIILCDHSKFERIAFVNVCKLQDADLLITGKELDERYQKQLRELNIHVMTV